MNGDSDDDVVCDLERAWWFGNTCGNNVSFVHGLARRVQVVCRDPIFPFSVHSFLFAINF